MKISNPFKRRKQLTKDIEYLTQEVDRLSDKLISLLQGHDDLTRDYSNFKYKNMINLRDIEHLVEESNINNIFELRLYSFHGEIIFTSYELQESTKIIKLIIPRESIHSEKDQFDIISRLRYLSENVCIDFKVRSRFKTKRIMWNKKISRVTYDYENNRCEIYFSIEGIEKEIYDD